VQTQSGAQLNQLLNLALVGVLARYQLPAQAADFIFDPTVHGRALHSSGMQWREW